ncbi:MAG: hypothetical protein HYU66_21890 [Armatimonadetes bacterium]|nr:hypothetical protein [Armatimonadota bacterium]
MRAAFLALAASLLTVWSASPADEKKPAYVGTDSCMRCHIDFARRWAALDHSKKLLAQEAPEKRGCEACHGAGGDHVAGRRKQIVRWKALDADARSGICLPCHAKLDAKLWDAGPHHKVASCDTCHEVHRDTGRDKMLRAAAGKDCDPCHADIADKIKAKLHHPVPEDTLSCVSCHNPHGTADSHLLSQPMGQLCGECHGDDVPKPETHAAKEWKLGHGKDAKGHEPECRMCHDQQTFCQECHAVPIPHPDNFVTEHGDLAKERQATCLQCHEVAKCELCHEDLPPAEGAAQGK